MNKSFDTHGLLVAPTCSLLWKTALLHNLWLSCRQTRLTCFFIKEPTPSYWQICKALCWSLFYCVLFFPSARSPNLFSEPAVSQTLDDLAHRNRDILNIFPATIHTTGMHSGYFIRANTWENYLRCIVKQTKKLIHLLKSQKRKTQVKQRSHKEQPFKCLDKILILKTSSTG